MGTQEGEQKPEPVFTPRARAKHLFAKRFRASLRSVATQGSTTLRRRRRSGRMETPTAAAVEELRALVAAAPDLDASSREWALGPSVCHRYLAAGIASAKPGAAEALPFLLRTARWRESQAVGGAMLADDALSAFEEALRPKLLYSLSRDRAGRPLMIERVGAWDLTELTRVMTDSAGEVMRAHVLVNERIRVSVDEAGFASEGADPRAVLVFDMDGLGLRHLASRKLLQVFSEMSKLDSDHFPHTVGTIFVVGAPRAFSALWAAASAFVAEGTKKKVSVFSWAAAAEAHATLRECVGEACLPRELGGELVGAPPYSTLASSST